LLEPAFRLYRENPWLSAESRETTISWHGLIAAYGSRTTALMAVAQCLGTASANRGGSRWALPKEGNANRSPPLPLSPFDCCFEAWAGFFRQLVAGAVHANAPETGCAFRGSNGNRGRSKGQLAVPPYRGGRALETPGEKGSSILLVSCP